MKIQHKIHSKIHSQIHTNVLGNIHTGFFCRVGTVISTTSLESCCGRSADLSQRFLCRCCTLSSDSVKCYLSWGYVKGLASQGLAPMVPMSSKRHLLGNFCSSPVALTCGGTSPKSAQKSRQKRFVTRQPTKNGNLPSPLLSLPLPLSALLFPFPLPPPPHLLSQACKTQKAKFRMFAKKPQKVASSALWRQHDPTITPQSLR